MERGLPRNRLVRVTDRHDFQEFVLAQLRRVYPLATPLRMLLDVLAWSAAAALAVYLRFDLSFSEDGSTRFWRVIPLVAGLQILTGYSVGLYRRRWRYGSTTRSPRSRSRRDHDDRSLPP